MPKRNLMIALLLLAAIQLVPYGRNHSNPPIREEPAWDRAETRETFFRTCANCHSHETVWPWYSHVAPASWLLQYDVDEGREHFNVSDWGRKKNHGDEAAKMVREDEMPPWFYRPAHPEGKLTEQQRLIFVAGLVATFGDEDSDDEDDGHEHD